MAKSRALSHFSRPPVIINMPRRGGRVRRAASRVVHVARRARGGARKALPTTSVLMGGAILGYGKQKGMLDKLPVIGGSKMITMGLAGWALRRYTHNEVARNVGLCAMFVAAYDWGRVQAGGTAGEEGDESGDNRDY